MTPAIETEPLRAPPDRRREQLFRRALWVLGAAAALGLLANLGICLWAQHEFTQVETIVALHANMLASGDGLYWDLNRYPFTVSPYGPIFYAASARLHWLGAPVLQGARSISFVALLATLWFAWRALGFLVADRYARVAGVLLATLTANLLFWGTTGQVDMLACCFSIVAFAEFLRWRERRDVRPLIASGLLVVLAVFTKQTALAAGVAIALGLLIEDRRRSVWWILGTGAAGVTAALALNAATSGHYFDDAIRANLNPFSTEKLLQHLQFFVLTSGGVLVVAAVGIRSRIGRLAPLYLYTALALGVWLATAPKTGSDLNYQIEGTLLLALCAACTLDRLHFFEKFIAGDRAWATLLQIPLLLHVVLNAVLITWNVTGRILLEPLKRAETAALRPYLEPRRGPVLSVALDPLLHWRGRMEVEALIYKLLVEGEWPTQARCARIWRPGDLPP